MVTMTAHAVVDEAEAASPARSVLPPGHHAWTVDDLDQIPDDGLHYELLDGVLLVSPAPVPVHQRVVTRLAVLLGPICPPHLEVFVAPLDWRPDRSTSLQPDLLVVRRDLIGEKNVTGRLELAVEVASPSTRRKDAVLKRSKYQDAGVASYWVIDPGMDGAEPSITAWDLVDGAYQRAGSAAGADSATLRNPFEVTVAPADLV